MVRLTRRDFLKIGVTGAALTGLGGALTGCFSPPPEVPRKMARTAGKPITLASTCRLCPAGCGILRGGGGRTGHQNQLNSTTVNSSTQVTANISIAPNAPSGYCDVMVSTGSEVVTCENAFFIIPPQPPSCVFVNPQYGYKGQTLDVTIIGADIIL